MATKKVNRIYSDIDLNFGANPLTGDVNKKYDVNAVKQALKNLILTQYYEKPFDPDYGSPIYGMLFENVDIISANSLKVQLELVIKKYEPRVRVENIEVEPMFDDNAFSVTIYFYVVGIPEPVVFSTILKRLR